MEIPPGSMIFEDPPNHDLHRGLLSRVFTPRKMNAIEPKVREFCARVLGPLVGTGGFDFIRDLGAQMPMRTIGMLLGIPEQDQEALRDRIDDGLRLEEGTMPDLDLAGDQAGAFEEYIDWRAEHPSDDLMTDRRAQVRRRRPVRRPPQDRPPPVVRLRHPLLPGCGAGAARGPRCARRGAAAVPVVGGRRAQRRPGADVEGARLGEAAGRHVLTRA
jgi:cytochrome P450